MSSHFWLGLQNDYDLDIEEDKLSERLEKDFPKMRSLSLKKSTVNSGRGLKTSQRRQLSNSTKRLTRTSWRW
jgi:hypothetical protein